MRMHQTTAGRAGLAVMLFLSALWLAVPPIHADDDAQKTSGRLTGVDLAGNLHRIADENDSKAAVVAFLSTECPISNGYLPLLNRMASSYRRRGIEFYGVISDPHVTRAEAVAHGTEYRILFPILFDASGELRRALAPTHTPHTFVVSPDGKVLYRGLIDDEYAALGSKKARVGRKYLFDALSAVIDGREIQVKETTPIGCLLEVPADETRQSDVTFCRDVAPVIQAHCVECHQPGQSAPFSLLTYEDVSRHARQIAAVTESRFMPPWKPEPDFGRFRDERRLTQREMRILARWTEQGKQRGSSADMPAAPVPPTTAWKLGKPDVVLTMPEQFQVPAAGADIFQHFVIPTGMADNRLIEAVEFHPGNSRVVHHASFYLDTTGAARRLDAADLGVGYGSFGGPGFLNTGTLRSWLPGMTPRRLPRGSGRPIERRSDLVMEIHYQRSGKSETDQSSIGLYYASRSARQVVAELQVLSKSIRIPAGARRHHERATYTLPVDTTLIDAAPHMHVLGTEIKATATNPDGRVEPLIWIKKWDFNWQGQYCYREPIRLPAGTRIDVDAWYDNSTHNPLNPNSPPHTVVWGDETTDEMLIGHFQCTCDSLEDIRTLGAHHWRYQQEQEKAYREAGGRK